jgi:predicted phosphodiesterase
MTKKDTDVLALFVADLHFSLTPPVFRSNELDWLATQKRSLDELKALQEKHNGAPIFCAGDIFDRWNSPAELINWAMEHLPYMHCIPGQHDLPEHDLSQIERSAYWTLQKASVIHHMFQAANHFQDGNLCVWSFPFGKKVHPCPMKNPNQIKIALIHEYNWAPGHKHPEAPNWQEVTQSRKEFAGYDLVVSGDNHSPFRYVMGNTQFVNCGTFMRRKSDERHYAPSVWMLLSDGSVKQHAIMTSDDKYLDVTEAEELEKASDMDLSNLIEGLGQLGECALDFGEAMKQQLARNPTNKRVRSILWKAMEK